MTTIKVADMHCEKCVARITKLLTEEGLDFEVCLQEQTVIVNGCEHCVKTALEALEDLGFEGKIIENP
jgi:copper chaperone CopZ